MRLRDRPAVLVAALWAAYALVTPWTTLWDRDEPRFARAAMEMLRNRQWLYATFNGALRPHKPMLVYWLMAAPLRALGPNAFAARAVSPLAMALTGYLVLRMARRFLTPGGA